MGIQYVGLIERFLASELRTDLSTDGLSACRELTADQLAFFSDQLSVLDREQHAEMVRAEPQHVVLQPERASGHVCVEDGDIRPTSAMFTHPYNSLEPIAIEHVKRQLLFFSRVAIRIPELRYGRGIAEQKRNFVEFLEAFIELKPLIEDGSVVLLPRVGFYSNEIEGGAAVVRNACTDDPNVQQWITANREMLQDFALGARPGDPFFDAGIRICSAISYGHTLAATHPFVGNLYKMLLSDSKRIDRGRIAATQNIDKIDLPGLGGLNWNDVRAIRRDEDSLRKWRADLAVAISSVDPNLPPEAFVERFDSQVQAQLQRAALQLEGDLKGSSSMTRFKKGTTNLMISAVAAAAKFAVCGPIAIWDAVLKIAKDDGPKEAIAFMWESREASAKKALRSHYAVFSSPSE
jgi:hypothetical protein